MAFFESIGQKIAEAGQGAYLKTKDMSDIVKLNSIVAETEKRLTHCYMKLGQLYYQSCQEENAIPEDYKDIFQDISRAQNEILNCRDMIKKIKGIKKCPSCGAEVSNGSLFCSVCGYKFSVDNGKHRCQKCGALLQPDALFCMECGTKVEAELENEATAEDDAVYCKKCGEKIEPETLFCSNCGAEVDPETEFFDDEKSESDSKPAKETVNTVPQQNSRLGCEPEQMAEFMKKETRTACDFCRNCGADLETDTFFCPNCGTKI